MLESRVSRIPVDNRIAGTYQKRHVAVANRNHLAKIGSQTKVTGADQ
jgi:hypothetical protein